MFPLLSGTPAATGGRKKVIEQPRCWTSCSAVCGVGFGCRHISCSLSEFVGASSAGLSCCTSSLQRDPRTRFVPRTVPYCHSPIQGRVAPSLPCLLIGALIHLWDSPVNVCITVRLSCRNTSPTSLPFPPLALTALISRLGCCLDSSLGEAVNPLQDAAEVCSECALPAWIYGTVRHLQPPPACCSRESVLWLLQLRAGQADVSLATDAVGFIMVIVCASTQPGCYWGARRA